MSTPLVNVSMGAPGILTPVPFATADYAGAGAGKLVGGPATGACDIVMSIVPLATTLADNFIRVFKKISGTLVHQYDVPLEIRVANAASKAWQAAISLGTLRLSASTEEIWLSMEKNEPANWIASYQQFNLG